MRVEAGTGPEGFSHVQGVAMRRRRKVPRGQHSVPGHVPSPPMPADLVQSVLRAGV